MNKKLVMSIFVLLLGFSQVINGAKGGSKELSAKERLRQAKQKAEERDKKLDETAEKSGRMRANATAQTAEASSVLARMKQKYGSTPEETPKPRKETKSGWWPFSGSYKEPGTDE